MLKRDISFLYTQLESPFLKHLMQSCKKIIHKGKQFCQENDVLKAVFQFTVHCLSFVVIKNVHCVSGSILICPFFYSGNVNNPQNELEMWAVLFLAGITHFNK